MLPAMKQALHLRLGAALVVGVLFLTLGIGCTSSLPLTIASVENKKTVVTPRFKDGFYRVDRDKDLYFVLRKTTTDPETKQAVEQIVLVRMFWRPLGGRTTMNPMALNATFRYIVMSPNAVGMYEGAGFVRIDRTPGKPYMKARIVDGDLRLTEASANFNDNLGRARFRGNFAANLSSLQEFDQAAAAQREFFHRSLELGKKAEGNTTQPEAATQP